MKRLLIGWMAVCVVWQGMAQEPLRGDSLASRQPTAEERLERLRFLDSITHPPPLGGPTDAPRPLEQLPLRPVIPHSSIYHVGSPRNGLRLYLLHNGTLQIGSHLLLSNGQAWLWSPYPNGYLDARTLSFPLP